MRGGGGVKKLEKMLENDAIKDAGDEKKLENLYTAGPGCKSSNGRLMRRSPGSPNTGNRLPCIVLPISPGTPFIQDDGFHPDSNLTNIPASPWVLVTKNPPLFRLLPSVLLDRLDCPVSSYR